MAASDIPAAMSLWTLASILLGVAVGAEGTKAGALGERVDPGAGVGRESVWSSIRCDLTERVGEGEEGRLAGRELDATDISESESCDMIGCEGMSNEVENRV